jgi:hypothetical protein
MNSVVLRSVAGAKLDLFVHKRDDLELKMDGLLHSNGAPNK